MQNIVKTDDDDNHTEIHERRGINKTKSTIITMLDIFNTDIYLRLCTVEGKPAMQTRGKGKGRAMGGGSRGVARREKQGRSRGRQGRLGAKGRICGGVHSCHINT